jgi:hypothetical protein
MPIINYDNLKQQLIQSGELPTAANSVGAPPNTPVQGTFTGQVAIKVPQLPKIDFPMDDLTFGSKLTGEKKDLDQLLSLKPGNGGKINNFGGVGSQIVINSDRIILNSRTNYLMLFGQEGVAISSQGNVNIDADDAITLYGDDGVFIGVPGKGVETGNKTKTPKNKAEPTIDNDYEPFVLGLKVANLLEDLLIVLKNATILTPVGKGYFREDVMYELRCLQARIPEMLSTYAYVDGISHEAPDPAPDPPLTVTEPPTTLVGTVAGTFTGTTSQIDPNAPSSVISNPLAEQPDFFETENLYNDSF